MTKISSMEDGGSVPKRRRQHVQKVVVSEKAEGHKVEQGTPADSWSWRKYGQKPIKGSPHPRGYYKCSSYRGCPARKQVEKCRSDASLIIITYTTHHNHQDYAIATDPAQKQDHNPEKSDAGVTLNNGRLHANQQLHLPSSVAVKRRAATSLMSLRSSSQSLLHPGFHDPRTTPLIPSK